MTSIVHILKRYAFLFDTQQNKYKRNNLNDEELREVWHAPSLNELYINEVDFKEVWEVGSINETIWMVRNLGKFDKHRYKQNYRTSTDLGEVWHTPKTIKRTSSQVKWRYVMFSPCHPSARNTCPACCTPCRPAPRSPQGWPRFC